jgi:Tfp pilus assembly protein PilV
VGVTRAFRKTRGLSLLETIIAFGVLVAGFAVFFRLYHSALTYSSAGTRKTFAASVAQRQLVKLRAWASEPVTGGRNFDNWGPFTNVTFSDPEHPDYQVHIQSAFVDAVSPNFSLITGPTGFEKKTMEATFRKVQITVSWPPQGEFELVSLIADPTRQLRETDPVVITGPSGAIARDTPTTMTLKAYDTDNREIPDLMARWYVKPIDGVGQIDANTSPIEGGSATFINASEKMDGTTQHTGGTCRVTARVVYRGQEAWGESGLLDLGLPDPPP